MLYFQFYVDEDKYVISSEHIVEIVPFVRLKSLPTLPDYAAGLMNYHDVPIPVVDLCQLLLGRPSRKRLSTRIIVLRRKNPNSSTMILGLIVEKATEAISIDNREFMPPTMKNTETAIDGLVAVNQGVLVTKVSVEDVFEKLDDSLFEVPASSSKEEER